MDKLTIETPEQVHLEFILAGIGSRFMATLLDMVIQALLYLVLFVVLIIFAMSFSIEMLFHRFKLNVDQKRFREH